MNEKLIGSQQLKKVAKAILRIGLAMGISEGLWPTGAMAAMAQQCNDVEKIPKSRISVVVACAFFCVFFFMVIAACWRRLKKMVESFEKEMRWQESELHCLERENPSPWQSLV